MRDVRRHDCAKITSATQYNIHITTVNTNERYNKILHHRTLISRQTILVRSNEITSFKIAKYNTLVKLLILPKTILVRK